MKNRITFNVGFITRGNVRKYDFIIQDVSPLYELLHITHRSTHLTFIYDILPTPIAEGVEVRTLEKYIFYL